jgi:hypothetical protein
MKNTNNEVKNMTDIDREEMLEIAKRKINQIMIPNDLMGVTYNCLLTDTNIEIDYTGEDNFYKIRQNGYWLTTVEA